MRLGYSSVSVLQSISFHFFQGSERQSKTQATGVRLKEATKINLSLSILGNVISALVDGKSTHIPYRNSKLTRLLQDSLGGNSKTVMCANISPADMNYVETISTLRYVGRAKNIQNYAHINDEPKTALLRQFQEQIAELKRQLEDGMEDVVSSEGDDLADNAIEDGLTPPTQVSPKKKTGKKQMEKSGDKEKSDAEKEMLEKRAQETQHELKEAQTEQEQIRAKLMMVENKILVGGINLLEKADEQEKLLEQSLAELELREKNEKQLKASLQKKEAERIDIEERYSSLQDECVGKTKKLQRVMQMLMGVKSELADQQQEQQREKEGIYDNIRSLSRELALCELVLNAYIPKEYQSTIERFTHWNEDIGEWQLKCVAYTGKNLRKSIEESKGLNNEVCVDWTDSETRNLTLCVFQPEFVDLSHVYLSYNTESVAEPLRQKTARPRTSGVPRPKTAGTRKYF